MRPVKYKTYKGQTFALHEVHLSQMMMILTPSSWTTFLDCIGSMKTRWLLPHSSLWVSHSSAHLHKSIDTTMDGKIQALDLFVMLHLNLHTAILMTITTWCHPPWVVWDLPLDTSPWKHTYPHIELSHRPWVSTQSAMDNAYHTMGSLDPSRYIFYALWVDQLDSFLT